MKLSLRKANKLQSRISNKLREVQSKLFVPQATYNIYTDVEDVMDSLRLKNEEFKSSWKDYNSLSDALAEVREIISVANSANGISNRLALISARELKLNTLQGIFGRLHIGFQPCPTKDEVERRLDGLIERFREGAASLRAEELVSFQFFSEEDVEDFENEILALKREIEILHDELEEINTRVTVDIPDSSVDLAKKFSIL